jgi:hypothetical protein
LIAATLFALYVLKDLLLSPANELRSAAGAPWKLVQPWIELLQAILIGYLLSASVYSLRAAARDLHALRPALDVSEAEFALRLAHISSFAKRPLVVVGLGSVCFGLSLPFMDGYWVGGRPPLGHVDLNWAMFRSALLAFAVGRTMQIEMVIAKRFSLLGRSSARVDLLDLSALAPFARRGLHSVLVLMLFAALLSLLLLAPFDVAVTSVTVVATLGIAIVALLLPVVGVHRRIGDAKRAELARVRAAIARERELWLGAGTAAGGAASGLADLLAYEARIASMATWPFDVTTLARFTFYVMLGSGSWLGSAFVERMLEAALD